MKIQIALFVTMLSFSKLLPDLERSSVVGELFLSRASTIGQNWVALTCEGVEEKSLGLNDDPIPRVAARNEEMELTRTKDKLAVKVNQKEVANSPGKNLVQTDAFHIISESSDGIAATHSELNVPSVHTLVISGSGTKALWTESSFSLGSTHHPISTLVSFKCESTS